jgi:phosphatidate cytidylyltransferase
MKRIVTGIILALLTIAIVLFGPWYVLVAAQVLFAVLGLWEFFRLAEAGGFSTLRWPGYAFALALSLVPLRATMGYTGLPIPGYLISSWMVAVSGLFLAVMMVAAMGSSKALSHYLGTVAATFSGPIYIAVPLALLVSVWMSYDGPYRVLFALIVIWAGDTAAYFVGRYFGRRKLAPRISPNKTWEGTVASLAAALLVAVAAGLWSTGTDSWWEPLPLAAALNVAGQLGDLAESALKRSAGVKDSSTLIPGHGGVLDRIDALLFAAPVLWYYWLWIGA